MAANLVQISLKAVFASYKKRKKSVKTAKASICCKTAGASVKSAAKLYVEETHGSQTVSKAFHIN